MRSGTSTRILDLTPLLDTRGVAVKRSRRRHKALLRAAALAFVLLAAGAARAEEAPPPADPCAGLRAESEHDPEPALIDHEGVRGMFFAMPTARLVLCEVRELRLRRQAAALDERELGLWRFRVNILEEQVRLSDQARGIFEDALGAVSSRSWKRSPILWFCVGVVVAVGLVVAAVEVLDAASRP